MKTNRIFRNTATREVFWDFYGSGILRSTKSGKTYTVLEAITASELVEITNDSLCPQCKQPLQLHNGPADAKPKEGDITVCVYCQTVLVFNKDLALRFPTPREETAIKNNLQLRRQLSKAFLIATEFKNETKGKN